MHARSIPRASCTSIAAGCVSAVCSRSGTRRSIAPRCCRSAAGGPRSAAGGGGRGAPPLGPAGVVVVRGGVPGVGGGGGGGGPPRRYRAPRRRADRARERRLHPAAPLVPLPAEAEAVIMRLWRGWTRRADADAYE